MNSLPDGWCAVKIQELTVRTKQRDPSKNPDKSFRYVDVSSVSNTLFKIETATNMLGAKAPGRARKEIKAKDVLFATIRPTLKRIALVPQELDGEIASTGYCVLRPQQDKVVPEFLYHSLLTNSFIKAMGALERGASYPAIRDSDVFSASIPLPSLSEQRCIAYVLSVVQTAIEQQVRLIKLTRELKSVLMCKLFTEGLRDEKQKVTEIGLVPQSWDVKPMAVLDLDIGDGNYSSKYPRREEFFPEGVPFIRANNIMDGRISWKDMRFISSELHEKLRKGHIKKDDVCVVTRGDIGQVAYVTEEFIGANMNAQLVRLNGKDTFDGRFLYFVLASDDMHKQFKSLTTGTALQQLPIGKLKFLQLPIPKKDEQEDIAHILWAVEQRTVLATKKKSCLEELFRTLLHQLMTGQTRVNEIDLSGLSVRGCYAKTRRT